MFICQFIGLSSLRFDMLLRYGGIVIMEHIILVWYMVAINFCSDSAMRFACRELCDMGLINYFRTDEYLYRMLK